MNSKLKTELVQIAAVLADKSIYHNSIENQQALNRLHDIRTSLDIHELLDKGYQVDKIRDRVNELSTYLDGMVLRTEEVYGYFQKLDNRYYTLKNVHLDVIKRRLKVLEKSIGFKPHTVSKDNELACLECGIHHEVGCSYN